MDDAPTAAVGDAAAVGNASRSALIEYRCVRPDDRRRADASDRVFIHLGVWAHCETGKLAPDHQFVATAGLSRTGLKRESLLIRLARRRGAIEASATGSREPHYAHTVRTPVGRDSPHQTTP